MYSVNNFNIVGGKIIYYTNLLGFLKIGNILGSYIYVKCSLPHTKSIQSIKGYSYVEGITILNISISSIDDDSFCCELHINIDTTKIHEKNKKYTYENPAFIITYQ